MTAGWATGLAARGEAGTAIQASCRPGVPAWGAGPSHRNRTDPLMAPSGRHIVRRMSVLPPPVVTTDRGFWFDLPPDQIWNRLEEFDQFESLWSWLSDFRVEGEGLQAGSVLYGSINPPLPYRMDVQVELVACDRPSAIKAKISGDLIGEAHLRFRQEDDGTLAEVTWTIEMRQPAMGLASRIGHPVLQWGHDRVVEMTVAGFRRRIAESKAVCSEPPNNSPLGSEVEVPRGERSR